MTLDNLDIGPRTTHATLTSWPLCACGGQSCVRETCLVIWDEMTEIPDTGGLRLCECMEIHHEAPCPACRMESEADAEFERARDLRAERSA